jgi:hypothetical protein
VTADRRDRTLAFLGTHGTADTPHLFGDLLTHLVGVEALVRSWGGSDLLCLVALGHATYGTDGFAPSLLEVSHRAELVEVIGEEAEGLVYFYASCDRSVFYPQLETPDSTVAQLVFVDRFAGTDLRPSAEAVTRFVDLTYANEAELAATSPDGPEGWTWLADFCRSTRRWASPGFYDGAMTLLGAND